MMRVLRNLAAVFGACVCHSRQHFHMVLSWMSCKIYLYEFHKQCRTKHVHDAAQAKIFKSFHRNPKCIVILWSPVQLMNVQKASVDEYLTEFVVRPSIRENAKQEVSVCEHA